ncbi:MAG: hypothetical protein ACI84R_000962 [Candidatus Azotimanducaceae bacterium]|jgi:hypothetical protein
MNVVRALPHQLDDRQSRIDERNVLFWPPISAVSNARTVWLYLPVPLSFRGVKEKRAEQSIHVSCETISRWTSNFSPAIAAKVDSSETQLSGIWHLEEPLSGLMATRRSSHPSNLYHCFKAIRQDYSGSICVKQGRELLSLSNVG